MVGTQRKSLASRGGKELSDQRKRRARDPTRGKSYERVLRQSTKNGSPKTGRRTGEGGEKREKIKKGVKHRRKNHGTGKLGKTGEKILKSGDGPTIDSRTRTWPTTGGGKTTKK